MYPDRRSAAIIHSDIDMGSKTGKRQRAGTSKLKTRTDEQRAHKKMAGVKDKLKSDINDGRNSVYVGSKPSDVGSKPSDDANGSLTIMTRCSPKDFIETVRVLSYEKAEAIAEMGFSAFLSLRSSKFDRTLSQMLVDCFDPASGSLKIHGHSFSLSHVDFEHIMGVNDGGHNIKLGGFSNHTERLQLMKHVGGDDEVLRREHLKKFLIETDTVDEIFRISFVLYVVDTILCPSSSEAIQADFLIPSKDNASICQLNWASFSFRRLLEGITTFQKNRCGYMSGCLIFLELYYFDVISHGVNVVDKFAVPVVAWGKREVNKLIGWIKENGGFGSMAIYASKDFSHKSDGIDQGNNAVYWKDQIAAEITFVKGDIRTLLQEALSEFQRSMEEVKATTMNSLVAEVLNSVRSLKEPNAAPMNLVHEINGPNPINIESEGGNEQRSSEIPSLIFLGEILPNHPKIVQDEVTVIDLNKSSNKSSGVKSLCSRSPSVLVCSGPRATETVASKPPLSKRALFQEVKKSNPLHKEQSKFSVGVKSNPTHQLKVAEPEKSHSHREVGVDPLFWMDDISQQDNVLMQFLFFIRPLTQSEKRVEVARHDGLTLYRENIASLAPQKYVFDDVINIMAQYFTANSKTSWFFPTFFGETAKGHKKHPSEEDLIAFAQKTSRFETFTGRIHNCRKIFIPLHDRPHCEHWFLLVVDLVEKKAEILDSYPDKYSEKRRLHIAEAAMWLLDNVFEEEIRHGSDGFLNFTSYAFADPRANPRQNNGHDCGIYVIRHMQYHRTRWFEGFCSADQRTRLALELVKDPLNELKETVMSQLPVTASHLNPIIGAAMTSNTGTKGKGLEVHDGLKKTVKTASRLDATGKPRKDYSWKARYRQRRGQ